MTSLFYTSFLYIGWARRAGVLEAAQDSNPEKRMSDELSADYAQPADLTRTMMVARIVLGFIALGLAVWLTLLRRKFGRSRFEMATMPGAIGGVLAGTIVIDRPLALSSDLELSLKCYRRSIGGAGPARSELLWHAEQRLSRDVPTDTGGTRIPVYFEIPCNSVPTKKSPGRVRWRLTAHSSMPGVD